MSDVLDLALLDETRSDEVNDSCWRGNPNARPVRETAAQSLTGRKRKAYCLDQIPGEQVSSLTQVCVTLKADLQGLVLLPGYMDPSSQASLIKWCLEHHSRAPNETNLDTHYDIPSEGLWSVFSREFAGGMLLQPIVPKRGNASAPTLPPGPRQLISNTPASVSNFAELQNVAKPPASPSPNAKATSASGLIRKLRWANIGWHYHWGTKQYDFSRGKIAIGPPIRSICKEIVQSIDWRDVFENAMQELAGAMDWGEDGPDWQEWRSNYGESLDSSPRLCLTFRPEPDAGIVNFYQYRVKHTL